MHDKHRGRKQQLLTNIKPEIESHLHNKTEMFKTLKNKLDKKLGKGLRYSVSKYERNLETVLNHQDTKMILKYDYIPENENVFLKHVQESKQTFKRCTKTIRRKHLHAAFNLL